MSFFFFLFVNKYIECYVLDFVRGIEKIIVIKQVVYCFQELEVGGKVNSFINEYIIINYDKCYEGKGWNVKVEYYKES